MITINHLSEKVKYAFKFRMGACGNQKTTEQGYSVVSFLTVAGPYTIFSCLTFLSITWREASSDLSSSKLMPDSTMRTMAW